MNMTLRVVIRESMVRNNIRRLILLNDPVKRSDQMRGFETSWLPEFDPESNLNENMKGGVGKIKAEISEVSGVSFYRNGKLLKINTFFIRNSPTFLWKSESLP